ncbi:MAG: hypothetical protein Q7R75_02490 [bacterium]|nr:hypothetical protein [bacterium]
MNNFLRNKRIQITFFCALLVIAGVVYFSLKNFNKQKTVSNAAPAIVTSKNGYESPKYDVFFTEPKTEPSKKEQSDEFFLPFLGELKEQFNSALDYFSSAPSVALTDEAYFKAVYTGDYIAYLNKLQDLMFADGYIKESDKIQIKDENDTFLLFNRFVGFLVLKKNITESEGELLKNGVNVTLRRLNAEERPLVEKQLLSSNVFKDLFANLMALISPAYAAQTKECYRGALSVKGEKPGFNGWASSCNAGYFCSYGCTYFDDCGHNGASCNVQTGCLNGACPNGAAIWDQQTGICGCGTPSGGL